MNDGSKNITNIEDLLCAIEQVANEKQQITIDAMLEVIGRRSFGPLLLMAGLVMAAPIIGDIPTVPTIIGTFVVLIAGQVLLRREYLWLPQWLLRRSIDNDRLVRTLQWAYPVARYVDRAIRPRLIRFTNKASVYGIAFLCVAIGAATPIMEIVPFSANVAGVAIAAFGLAITAHDGFLALVAFLLSGTTFALIVYALI